MKDHPEIIEISEMIRDEVIRVSNPKLERLVHRASQGLVDSVKGGWASGVTPEIHEKANRLLAALEDFEESIQEAVLEDMEP